LAAIAALGLDRGTPLQGFSLWAPLAQSVTLTHAGEEVRRTVRVLGPERFEVEGDDVTHVVTRRAEAWWVDDDRTPAVLWSDPTRVSVFWSNNYHFTRIDPLARGGAEAGTAGVIEAPMPGQVRSVQAKAGDVVAKGDRLVVVEAMKMEHSLTAPRDGTVAEVLTAPGAQVEAGAALIRLEEEDTP
jgi:3-methylcrotonyl-CoA carboxylase alpha subunit